MTHEASRSIGILTIGVILVSGAGTALGEPSPAESAVPGLEEVVVTARKVTENLQDVPLAITVIDKALLENSGAQDLRDVLEQAPGVVVQGTAAGAYTSIEIRGQYNFNFTATTGGSPNVAVFLDGVYLQNPNAVNLGLFGIDRVEVVEGPQSALYGRNAFAGAVNYVSIVPSDTFHADAKAEFGKFGNETAQGYVSGPLIPGLLRVGVGYNYQYSGGDYTDPETHVSAGGYEKRDVKFNLDFTPFDHFDLRAGYYHGSDHFDQDPLVFATNNCLGGTAQCGEFVANPVEIAPIPASSGDSGLGREVNAASLKLSYDTGFADFSYLGGYNDVVSREYEDFTAMRAGLPFVLTPGPGSVNVFELFGEDDNSRDTSQELRITSKQNESLRWSVGGDYFNSRLATTTLIGENGAQIPAGQSVNSAANFFIAGLFVTPNGAPSTSNFTLGAITEKTYSGFASLEYDVIPALTVGGEFRQTYDRQTLDIERNSFIANLYEPFGSIAPAGFHFNNYRGYLKYKFTDDVLAYASIATGTKAGGFNTQAFEATNQTYGPETNRAAEFGVKTELLDHRLLINADVFNIQSHDLQQYFPSGNGINTVIQNIGGTTNTGFEFATTFRPIQDLTVSAGAAYVDPRYTSGSVDTTDLPRCQALGAECLGTIITAKNAAGTPFQAVNLDGLLLPRVSKVTANAAVDYQQVLTGDYRGFVHLDYRWEGRQFNSVDQLNDTWISARSLLNLRFGIHSGPYTAALFVTNAFNDETPYNVAANTELNNLKAIAIGSLPSPRIFGVSVTGHW